MSIGWCADQGSGGKLLLARVALGDADFLRKDAMAMAMGCDRMRDRVDGCTWGNTDIGCR